LVFNGRLVFNGGYTLKNSFLPVNSLSRSLIACGALALTALITGPAFGQGFPEDWSHHHLVFSNPGSYQDAVRNGKADRWQTIVNDPRYQHQLAKRGPQGNGSANAHGRHADANASLNRPPSDSGIHRDWSMAVESTSTTTLTGSSANATDFTVTSTAGFSVGEYITIGAKQASNNTEIMLITGITVANGGKPDLVVKRAQLGTTANSTFSNGALVTANIRSFLTSGVFAAKYSFFTNTTANCSTVASPALPDFVVYPTFVSGSGGAQSTAGAAGTANIIAFDDIYSGCAGYLGTGPPVYWSYNTSGDVVTSPILSTDGKQVAFLQSPTGATTASTQLVVLKYKPGEGTAAGSGSAGAQPSIPTLQQSSGSNCLSASGSCSVTLNFAGTATSSGRSSPFVDYFNDILYVGDDQGQLHKFQNVFRGTPSEVTTGWPVQLGTAPNQLSSPVYDSGSLNVFVGGADGVLYKVLASSGAVTASSAVALGGVGVSDAPILDSQAGQVYILNPGTGTSTSSLLQFPVGFSANATGTSATLAPSTTTTHPVLFSGTFDNQYFSSGSQTGPTGAYYVCAGDATGILSLYRVPITNNVMGTVPTPLAIGSATGGQCSPVTEFFNNATPATTVATTAVTTSALSVTATSTAAFAPNSYIQIDSEVMLVTAVASPNLTVTRAQLNTTAATHAIGAAITGDNDWLFVSTTANGAKTGCTGACLYSFSGTGLALPANAAAGLIAPGGTTGLVIDNRVASTTGSAQVYYSPLIDTACTGNNHPTGNVTPAAGCAIQASQAALQ
jgi:hypothetical protein